jgi:hypothetical protein
MIEPPSEALLQSEEEKRRRNVDPVTRWRQFQALCGWLDSQQPIPRNSKAGCLAQQEKWRRAGLLPPLPPSESP